MLATLPAPLEAVYGSPRSRWLDVRSSVPASPACSPSSSTASSPCHSPRASPRRMPPYAASGTSRLSSPPPSCKGSLAQAEARRQPPRLSVQVESFKDHGSSLREQRRRLASSFAGGHIGCSDGKAWRRLDFTGATSPEPAGIDLVPSNKRRRVYSAKASTAELGCGIETSRAAACSSQGQETAVERPSTVPSDEPASTSTCSSDSEATQSRKQWASSRRGLLAMTIAGLGAASLAEAGLAQAAAQAPGQANTAGKFWLLGDVANNPVMAAAAKAKASRVYDATILGEPGTIGDKTRVWQRLMSSRIVYLGEAEKVPDLTDKVLELEIIQHLREECFAQKRPISVALSAFPRPMQPQLNLYMGKKISDQELRALVPHWSDRRWSEVLPTLQYCRDAGARLIACGAPEEILRTVQAKGVQGLTAAERRKYAPPPFGGSALHADTPITIPGLEPPAIAEGLPSPKTSVPFGPGPYQFAQARMVLDHTMAQAVTQAMVDGGAVGVLVVITGASHVKYGARGRGVPARVQSRLKKSTQAVVLLNPERQHSRFEGDVPEADFFWYSGAKACTHNCFDRAEVARVMGAAGRSRDALPKDIQLGLESGLVSPDTLKSFLELDRNPILAEATKRFQGLRERWLADPRFLERLFIEEAISITTTLIAQYERRKERFWEELEYVITDTTRGAVVDFFTVWLPAPRLSFSRQSLNPPPLRGAKGALQGLQGLLGALPDNAFQRSSMGDYWSLEQRVGAVVIGGLKLFVVGFVSSMGTLGVSNGLAKVRLRLTPELQSQPQTKRSPLVKTAVVYASFLGTSANLRYQAIAGIVEHWGADYLLASQPLLGSILSFVARTANSYWGTGQWVDLARLCGLQSHKGEEEITHHTVESPAATVEVEVQLEKPPMSSQSKGDPPSTLEVSVASLPFQGGKQHVGIGIDTRQCEESVELHR